MTRQRVGEVGSSTKSSTDKNPHTLTISKAGYQDCQEIMTINRKMDLEVALSAPAGGVFPTNLGLVPLGVKQVAI